MSSSEERKRESSGAESDDRDDRGDNGGRSSREPTWEWETDPAGDPEEREVVGEAKFEAEGWDEIPADPEEASRLLRALEGIMPDVLKRTLSAGVEGLATGEERIRETLSDRELPREALRVLLRYADLTKRELLRLISREIRHFLEDMDFGGEIAKILTSLSLEARMQVRFIPNEDAVQPNASGSVKVSQGDVKGGGEEEREHDVGEDLDETDEASENEAPWASRWRERWDRATDAVSGKDGDPWERFRQRKESTDG